MNHPEADSAVYALLRTKRHKLIPRPRLVGRLNRGIVMENRSLKALFFALLVTILIFSAVIPAYGQGEDPPSLPTPTNQDIRFTHITRDDGLSDNRVFAIVQDQAGFLWMGTKMV